MLTAALSAPSCVRFENFPTINAPSNDPALYRVKNKDWKAYTERARTDVRGAHFDWLLVGDSGEVLARPEEVRAAFSGVIFVGDSQIREVAWAGLKMLLGEQKLRFYNGDKVFGRRPRHSQLQGHCVPQSVGKTGFTATCGADAAVACDVHSPFDNATHAEKMRKLLLTRPHEWDGTLRVSPHVCDADFFVSYQATWGANPVSPDTIPRCLHPARPGAPYRLHRPHGAKGGGGKSGGGKGGGGAAAAAGSAAGSAAAVASGGAGAPRHRPVLWIVDGCGLHEMEFCSELRHGLPNSVLSRFHPQVLRSSVVYQTVGAGFLMPDAKRYKGACASLDADQVAATEAAWLDARGVRRYNYTSLALQYAPLMFDAIHYTYYWVPCTKTFPEMTRLVAQLAFQQALGRPVDVCPPGAAAPVDDAARARGLKFRLDGQGQM